MVYLVVFLFLLPNPVNIGRTLKDLSVHLLHIFKSHNKVRQEILVDCVTYITFEGR